MRAITPWLGALLTAALSASLAIAQYPMPPYGPQPPMSPQGPMPPFAMQPPQGGYPGYAPQVRWLAPDACGPGYYTWCPDGSYIGPNYWLHPPYAPFNGILPGGGGMRPPAGLPQPPMPGQAPMAPKFAPKPMVVFPSHPYARSPRDFFMWSEAQEDRLTRERRPSFVP